MENGVMKAEKDDAPPYFAVMFQSDKRSGRKRHTEVEWGEQIEGYCYRAVFTRSINLLRSANRSEQRLSLLTAINDRRMAFLESKTGNPQRDAETADLRRVIHEALEELPPKSRRVFCMSYVDGMRHPGPRDGPDPPVL